MAAVITSDEIPFARYMEESDPRAKMRPASSYRNLVKHRFAVGVQHLGTPLPWGKTEDKLRFRKGEVSLWAGENGSGKSLAQGQVMMGLMRAGIRCAIASFEMKPEVTLTRMTRQASMGRNPTEAFIDAFHDWTEGRLWLYDHRGRIAPDLMLAVVKYAHDLGIEHLCIDSLMKVVKGEDDYNGQKDFVDALCQIAGDTGMHIHLVHHLKKGDSTRPGSKGDVKGSGAITDQVDNVIVWWRNKGKEAKVQAGATYDAIDADALMIVEKQRNGEWEGRVALYFDPESTQYVGAPDAAPIDFLQALEPRRRAEQRALV